jgi:hypothetical protein
LNICTRVVRIGRVSQVVLSPNPEPGFCDSHEPTRFQLLALECAFTEDELRGLLRRLIAKKLGWATPRRVLVCLDCGCEFELSERRARQRLAEGKPPRCRYCAGSGIPGPDVTAWMEALPPDVRQQAVAALATLAA